MNENLILIGKKFIENYIFSFDNRDADGMTNLFNITHIRFANNNVSIISKNEYLESQYKVTKLLKMKIGIILILKILKVLKVVYQNAIL